MTRAWRKASESHPTLRAVLDAHVKDHPALRCLREAEQRMLVLTAGLADANEPEAETTATGAAFETLLRHGSDVHATRTRGASRASTGFLRRVLTPSA